MNRQQRRAAAKQGAATSGAAGTKIPTLYAAAAAHHQAGRLAEAEPLYRAILAIDPDHPESNHSLGVMAYQVGRADLALPLIAKAIAAKGEEATFHGAYGVVLKDQGRLDEAIASYRRAIALKPAYADAHSNLGSALRELGKLEEAIASNRRALSLKPDFPEAHGNLGNALQDQGKLEEAAASYQRAIALRPAFAQAHSNLGSALRELGKLEDAIASVRRALALKPDFPEAHNNLGAILKDQGQLTEAVASFQRAIALKPTLVDAHSHLGDALKDQGRLTEAVDSYQRAIALNPAFAQPHVNLGNVLTDQGKLDEAVASYERALSLEPDHAEGRSNLLMSQHYVRRIFAAERLASARQFGAQFAGQTLAKRFANDPSPARRLRIGYISGDLCLHPVGYLLVEVLETQDRAGFKIFCYANQTRVDDMTRRLQAASDHWRTIFGVSDADVAAMIAKDEIDILVDLSGHTGRNRLLLFAQRAAPVQTSWLGYFGTTGLSAMDYLVMDEATIPSGDERWCSEAVVRLPHGRFCYAPPDYAPPPTEPPAIRRGAVTFGSFNNIAKIGPEVVSLWSDVLRAMPQSRLVLKWKSFDDEDVRARLSAAFLAAGINGERLELRGQSRHADMLAEYGDVDVALDPFPFCGGLTSCEALWMGLPIVTWPDDRPASRQTAGFLQLLGLDECVARSRDDYVRIAAGLAADLARLTDLRRQLRPRMAASPLCDGTRFTPTLEAAFREMWRRWCAGEGAKGFAISSNKSAAQA